ncbi:MAG: TIGR01212 family radical SAM protein [bacterium]
MKLLNEYLKERFGCKVYKLALSGAGTCPNRDGTLDTRGCIFCSEGGSGDFAADAGRSVHDQILEARKRVEKKNPGGKYIAYFQSFTGTYAPLPYLRKIFTEALEEEDIVALSVGTRPDCLGEEVLSLLSGLNRIKPVWVELGLQTIHERTAEYIRRGYPLSVYDQAVRDLHREGLEVIVHVILGLPGESREDMLETVRYVAASGADGIKLQLLHVLKGTDLEKEYLQGRVPVMTLEEYTDLLKEIAALIPEKMVVHRLTGDGPKKLLLAPLWSADKKRVLNTIRRELDLKT